VAKAFLLPTYSTAGVFALAIFLGILGQIGDLCESALKRAFGAKESGWLIPGHGGVLDRADSLIFPVAFMYYYLALWV
jgi:phosphatidate cytidylyltransferase